MPATQVIGGLGDEGVEHAVAGEAEDMAAVVGFQPLHGLGPAVVTVATPGESRGGPMLLHAPREMLDRRPHLGALGRARGAQDGDHGQAGAGMIDMAPGSVTGAAKPRSS